MKVYITWPVSDSMRSNVLFVHATATGRFEATFPAVMDVGARFGNDGNIDELGDPITLFDAIELLDAMDERDKDEEEGCKTLACSLEADC